MELSRFSFEVDREPLLIESRFSFEEEIECLCRFDESSKSSRDELRDLLPAIFSEEDQVPRLSSGELLFMFSFDICKGSALGGSLACIPPLVADLLNRDVIDGFPANAFAIAALFCFLLFCM